MKILSITAGAADMYCGSCLRDNALAAELLRRGHDVTLMPVYTPTLTDEVNVSTRNPVLFGGISVYLEQNLPLFRHTPRLLDRLWDAAPVIKAFAGRSMQVDPRFLGEMTVSMLKGEHGHQKKEFDKLIDWLSGEPAPDIVNLPNSLLIAMAGPIRRTLKRPVVVTMQGEDLFLDGLQEPYKTTSIDLIRRQVNDVDLFIAVSEFYVERMHALLGIPLEKIAVVPLGINFDGYDAAWQERREGSRLRVASLELAKTPWHVTGFRVGYFARIAPEKGLLELAEAYRVARHEKGLPVAGGLYAAGYLAAEHKDYLALVEERMRDWGLGEEFHYSGTLDREHKIGFLRSLDVLCVPGPYPDPKGTYLLEAMASGTPVVQPRRGAFPEIVDRTGGGLLVEGTTDALAEGIVELWRNPDLAASLGARGAEGVRLHYSVAREADRVLEVFEHVVGADA
jgi:glycosyltransferase involved in cell wall biosynthesis